MGATSGVLAETTVTCEFGRWINKLRWYMGGYEVIGRSDNVRAEGTTQLQLKVRKASANHP